ncbi:MAG TPA: phosphonate ABC transporter ATP-binding protein [Flavobacteriales bacterium]|nr:phosphonate ABC transporter ATP-binding protein [Flavobacteriales bacterium]|tara:strand:- start:31700 stop:32389 length:690 start_codon:yes stop_codon:yes gene_type:complete
MDKTLVAFQNAAIHQNIHNQVLKDVNFSIDKGDFVYLIGKTGSGKSSLLKTLYADLPLLEGEALVCGFNLRTIKKKQIPELRRKLGIVFQDFRLLTDRSVDKNLEFVLRATGWTDKVNIKNRIEEVLTKVGLMNKGYKMPHELSGGEQQRVAIARALLNDPELIIADEPTGNLDPETSEEIIDILYNLHEDKAVLLATHDYELMKKFEGSTLICENQTVIFHRLHPSEV